MVSTLIAGCSFHLRGSQPLPFQTLYIPNAIGGIALDLKRNIEAGTNAKVVSDPKGADAVLQLSNERRDKIILSLSGTGRVREFRLRYSVNFRLHDGHGRDYIPFSTLELSRDVTYNDTDILAKESEETLLFNDMQADAVQQLLRRLAAARSPASGAS